MDTLLFIFYFICIMAPDIAVENRALSFQVFFSFGM